MERTTFVIAHRCLRSAIPTVLWLLEQGRIIERGTHDELIEEKGRYYQLYTGKCDQRINKSNNELGK